MCITFHQPNWRGLCKHETKSNFLVIIMGISIYGSVDNKNSCKCFSMVHFSVLLETTSFPGSLS